MNDFAHLKNTCFDSEQNGYGTELSTIEAAITEQTLIPQDKLLAFFRDMLYVVPCLERKR